MKNTRYFWSYLSPFFIEWKIVQKKVLEEIETHILCSMPFFSKIVPFMRSSSSSIVICQTTGPKPLPKRFLHIVRSRASSFNWQYPLLSLSSSSSFLRLLPRLLVTSICPFIFPSIICFSRQFLRKMWPIQLEINILPIDNFEVKVVWNLCY